MCIFFLVLAERWFHSKERILATSIGVYSNYAGIGLGYLFSPLIVGNDGVFEKKINYFCFKTGKHFKSFVYRSYYFNCSTGSVLYLCKG